MCVKFDYLIKSNIAQLKQDVSSFERMAYMYQNDQGGRSVSGKEKMKRMKAISEFKESATFAIKSYEDIQM